MSYPKDQEKPYLLFVVPFLPSRFYPHEKNKLAHKSLKRLAIKHRVVLVSLVDPVEKPYFRIEDYSFCYRCFFINVSIWRQMINRLSNPSMPDFISEKIDTRMFSLIRELDADYSFLSFWGENILAAYYSCVLKANVKKRIVLHDFYSERLEEMLVSSSLITRQLIRKQLVRLRKWERKILNTVDEVIVFNRHHADLLISSGIAASITIEEPVVSNKYKHLLRSDDLIEKYSIIYWGSLGRLELRNGLFWFLDEILPLVQLKYPMVKVYIVGANKSGDIQDSFPDNVILTGFVLDPMEYFRKAALAVAPVCSGRGSRMKILELISACIPTVTTTLGAQGIDENSYLYVEDDPVAFADRVKDLLAV